MISFLGSRGKLAAGAGAGVGLAAALMSLIQRNWGMATALVILAAVWIVAASTWGVARAVHGQLEALDRRITEVRRHQNQQGEGAAVGGAKKLHSKLDKLEHDVERIALTVGPAKSDKYGTRALERRYADVLTQPASVPNSQLLAYLEILAKEATTRRADVAVIQDLLTELRSLRALQADAAQEAS